ncbi:MAG: hypothetical protein ACRDFX_06025 [Chloroflexota bacterium]
MSDTHVALACPHCYGTHLDKVCMQPVHHFITYFQDRSGKRSYSSRQEKHFGRKFFSIVADYVESRELLCRACNCTLTESELVAC